MAILEPAFHVKAVLAAAAVLLTILVATLPGYAQGEKEQGIIATGHGEVQGQPDIARVAVAVLTQAKDQGQAAAQNATLMTAVQDALTSKLKLAKKDIETFGYSVRPQYDYQARPPKLTGYEVVNTVRVSIRDLSKIGAVIDAAMAAGANSIQGISFEIENDEPLRKEALVKALTIAREKADVIARTLGIGLGPVVTVRESVSPSAVPYAYSMMRAEAMVAAAPETPVQPRELTISADVTVVFGVK